MTTKIPKAPLGATMGYLVTLGTTGRNAPAWLPGRSKFCFQMHGFKIKCAAPPGLWLRVLMLGAHGLTHTARLALEPKLDQQPSFPRFHSNQLLFKSTSIQIN